MKLVAFATGGTIASARGDHGLAAALPGSGLTAGCGFDEVREAFCLPSPELSPADWLSLAREMEGCPDADGFVVTHGTDTMTSAAATLAFLGAGGARPVVLTGAMKAPSEPGADGPTNLKDAELFARELARRKIRGVFLAFGGSLLWGAGLVKRHWTRPDGFLTPACPALGRIEGGSARLNTEELASHSPRLDVPLPHALPSVCGIKIHPGLTSEALLAWLPLASGFVIESYGCGSGPIDGPCSIMPFLLQAARAGKPVVNVTDAEDGVDLTRYRNGQIAAEAGMLSGRRMTFQAACARLSCLLARQADGPFASLWEESICGE